MSPHNYTEPTTKVCLVSDSTVEDSADLTRPFAKSSFQLPIKRQLQTVVYVSSL